MKSAFQTFLETVPDAMVVVDCLGRIAAVNRQTQHLFGYSQSELIGLQVEVLVPERYRGSHSQHREGYFGAPSVRPMGAAQELYGRRKDGSSVLISETWCSGISVHFEPPAHSIITM